MQIVWHGQACFQITASPQKNNQLKIVIDPFSEEVGLKIPKMDSDVLMITHNHYDHNNLKAVGGNPFIIEGPGEYEVKQVFINGIHSWHDQKNGIDRGSNTIYTIEVEEIKICHLGDLGQDELNSEQLERMGNIDILMVPIGGIYTIDAKSALKIISQIDPKIIIPMHYFLPKLKIKLDGVDKFLKEIGVKQLLPLPKLSIKKNDLQEESKVIVLSP